MTDRPLPRTVEVIAKQQITPNMLRITLGGPGLAGFPTDSEGGYIKLRLYPGGPETKPVVRTYTIRNQREGEIDVDFVLHQDASGEHGPATSWALSAKQGEPIEIGGPGPAKPMPIGRAFYLVAGDMTAIPAISVNLANLPDDTSGVAVIEIQTEADKQDLDRPAGIGLEWVINPAPGTNSQALSERLRKFDTGISDVYGWAASEFNSMRALRDYLRTDRGLGSDRLYISSYWKAGLSEELHKLAKRSDSESNG